MDEQLTPEIQAFVQAFTDIKTLDDDLFTDETFGEIIESIDEQFSPERVHMAVVQIVQNLEAQGITRAEAQDAKKAVLDFINEIVYGDGLLVGNKKKVIDHVIGRLTELITSAYDRYHAYSIELPIQLDEGAHVPTYAHDGDAAADLYAAEDVTIPAHFLSTPVKTGVHIQLPEGWVAMVLPRSSMGFKTPLRLSNSQGVVDSCYRGEVLAIYDNIGDEPYEIHKGDRIAQLYVMPSHRFKPVIMDSLEDSDRGEGGFGSTGV